MGEICVEREPARVAPGEEPRHGRGVRRARVRVADLGREKLHRPLRGVWPGPAHGWWPEGPRSASLLDTTIASDDAATSTRAAGGGRAGTGGDSRPCQRGGHPSKRNITSFMLRVPTTRASLAF